jgi:hypothetical protein
VYCLGAGFVHGPAVKGRLGILGVSRQAGFPSEYTLLRSVDLAARFFVGYFFNSSSQDLDNSRCFAVGFRFLERCGAVKIIIIVIIPQY